MNKATVKQLWDTYDFSFLLILFFLTEFLNDYVLIPSLVLGLSPSSVFKIGVIVYIFSFLILKRKWGSLVSLVVFLICYLIGFYFLNDNLNFPIPSIYLFSKYLFLLFILFYFKERYSVNHTFNTSVFFKIFEIIVIGNSVLILLGFIFELDFFYTYNAMRFGFKGILPTSSTTSYFYIFSTFYFYLKSKQDKKNYIYFVFILFVSLLIGTKAMLIFNVLLGGLFISELRIKAKNKFFLYLMVLLLFFTALYFLLNTAIFNKILDDRGLVSAIFSVRDVLFLNQTKPFIDNNWSFINYIVGGVNGYEVFCQLGFIDLFLFFGFLGGFYYIFTISKILIFYNASKHVLFFYLSLALVIGFSGNFFYNASIPIYLVLIQYKLLETRYSSLGNQ